MTTKALITGSLGAIAQRKVRIGWYCGYFVGPMKWHYGNDWYYEPDECATEFETEEDLSDWQEGYCQATCPTCGGTLEQSEAEPWLIGEVL